MGETVDYADLEALDLSKLDQPGGKQALAEQVLSFINKNGNKTVWTPSKFIRTHKTHHRRDNRFLLRHRTRLHRR